MTCEVLFSWEAELINELTADKAALESAVDAMSWPGWNTDTAAGLAMAGTVLQNGGRPDVTRRTQGCRGGTSVDPSCPRN